MAMGQDAREGDGDADQHTIHRINGAAACRTTHAGVGVWTGRAVLGLLLVVVALGASGVDLSGDCHGARPAGLSPPGHLVDLGGYRLHLFCTGSQTAGLPPSSWTPPSRHRLDLGLGAAHARHGRACAPTTGPGWFGATRVRRRAMPQQPAELHTLLQQAGVAGPYVLVGHSLGGLSVRMYADQYPEEVAGMVLIEGTNPDAWQRLGTREGGGVDPHPAGGRAVAGAAGGLPP